MAAATHDDPVGVGTALRREGRDRIEQQAAVVPDPERQVPCRVGVAGADRAQVGVVDQQAGEPEEQAGRQVAAGLGWRGLVLARVSPHCPALHAAG